LHKKLKGNSLFAASVGWDGTLAAKNMKRENEISASAFASSEVQNPQNFPFIFFKIPRARFSEKELENFSVFESSELSGRGSRRIQEINSFFGKRFERGCIFVRFSNFSEFLCPNCGRRLSPPSAFGAFFRDFRSLKLKFFFRRGRGSPPARFLGNSVSNLLCPKQKEFLLSFLL
jgi:hypothetical protein